MVSTITSQHGQAEEGFGEEERRLLGVLLPPLKRAAQLHRRVASLAIMEEAALQLLDQWTLGIILLDTRGRVTLMNRAAERITSQKDGLLLERRRLCVLGKKDTVKLERLIAGATQPNPSVPAGGAMLI